MIPLGYSFEHGCTLLVQIYSDVKKMWKILISSGKKEIWANTTEH